MVFHIVNFESQTTNKVMKQKLEITTQTLNFIPKGKQNENIRITNLHCFVSSCYLTIKSIQNFC